MLTSKASKLKIFLYVLLINLGLHASTLAQEFSSNDLSTQDIAKYINSALDREIIRVDYIQNRGNKEILGIEFAPEYKALKIDVDMDKIRLTTDGRTSLIDSENLTDSTKERLNQKAIEKIKESRTQESYIFSAKADYTSDSLALGEKGIHLFQQHKSPSWSPLDLIGRRYQQSKLNLVFDYSFTKDTEILVQKFQLEIETDYYKQPDLYGKKIESRKTTYSSKDISSIIITDDRIEVKLGEIVVSFLLKKSMFQISSQQMNYKKAFSISRQSMFSSTAYLRHNAINSIANRCSSSFGG